MAWEHHVVLVAVPLHLEDPAAAAGTHETPDAALIDDLQGLGEMQVVQEVQGAQLLVGGAPGRCEVTKNLGGNGVHPHRVHRLHVIGESCVACLATPHEACDPTRPQKAVRPAAVLLPHV